MELTPKERLLRAINFEDVDIIPLTGPFAGSPGLYGGPFLEDETIPKDKRQALAMEMTINPPAISLFRYRPDVEKKGWDRWGVYWEKRHDVRHPLEDWDDYVNYKFPEIDPDLFPEEEMVRCRQEGKTLILGGNAPITTFERYRTLRGFENALIDPLLYPDRCQELIERITDYNIKQMKRWIEIGCDIIGFADDLGSNSQLLMNPEIWRKFYKPVYRRMCDLIHESGAKTWMHSDGAITAIIPDLIEIGLDILDPVQAECMDVYELSANYKKQLVIEGGFNSRLISKPEADYNTVRSHMEETIRVFNGFSGGMIGTSTNLLIPSIDVALALYHAYRNFTNAETDR